MVDTVYTKSDTSHQSYNQNGYNNAGESSIGPQIRTDYYNKKALIELKKKMFFGPMADTTSMPKNMGKTIKRFHYLPMLDDANVNDQGIDAAGQTKADGAADLKTIVLVPPGAVATGLGTITDGGDPTTGYTFTGTGTGNRDAGEVGGSCIYGTGVDDAAAQANAMGKMAKYITVVGVWATDLATWKAAGGGANETLVIVADAGNLYGSSKDVSTISGKMPALSEHGGRVNRVGFKRVELEGTLEKFGFFDEYTQESLDFDTDSELMMHVNREMLNGANEITEDALQIDLLNGAGVVRYAGSAVSKATITPTEFVTYDDLMRLSIDLDNNRCPKHAKMITGSRMVDTRVIDSARYMYVGTEMIPMLRAMVDNHGNPALILTQHYGSATTIANGELGSIDQFRIIVVPEMMKWSGAGVATTEPVYETGGDTDVFPMLVIGSESFTTIGFQNDGKTVKFKITHKKPGKEIAARNDPYGEIGFMSIKWYYGFMMLRPERLALILTAATL